MRCENVEKKKECLMKIGRTILKCIIYPIQTAIWGKKYEKLNMFWIKSQ